MNGDLVVILTALNLEYQAVREKLTDLRLHQHPAGTRFEVGRLPEGNCRVALALVGKGNHPAAVLAERAIAEFDPAALLFVGVAGALRPSIALGDVVVATHIYAYHGGTSEDDGLKARPRVWEISHATDQVARHIERVGDWKRHLGHGDSVPTVRFGPIAAGEVVQNSRVSDHARWVRQHYNDALAIEMEAAGVAQAAHLNGSLPVIVVRGISDRADGTKAVTDGENWQPRAVANAAAFATALAQSLIVEGQGGRPAAGRQTVRGTAMSGTFSNSATGNARVGVQAGQVNGNILVASEPEAPASLNEQVARFREQLRQMRMTGRLDEATYMAAEAELQVVTESLAAGTAQSKSALMVALKRLRGLTGDVMELAAKLAAIIALAGSTS
ncbi:purine phosphorylase [Micromonospora sp. NPDC050417]|uniref:5'-methylthioadenosine/S-adenosylhomocysteine nucleosidase family protein n=1 Tax=Micromonospora sp. NPDC050417 TaxID=3364280 RepID=UPI003793875E